MNSKVKRTLATLARLALVSLAVVTMAGFLGRYFWLSDLLSHFRVQYFWLLALVVAAFGALRSWRWTSVALLFFAINLGTIAPLFLSSARPSKQDQSPLSLLLFNVNSQNTRIPEVAAYLAKEQSDVIVIIEATHEMQIVFAEHLPNYQIIAETRENAFGMLVLSKLPILSQRVMYLGDAELPAIQLDVEKEGTAYALLGVHTMPPVGAAQSKLRDHMLEGAAKWARGKTMAIVLGALNATPWSYAFQDLLERGLVSLMGVHGRASSGRARRVVIPGG